MGEDNDIQIFGGKIINTEGIQSAYKPAEKTNHQTETTS